jgi:L-rhamnose mutarotase
MILDVDKTFSFEQKSQSDLENKKVQEWELLMERFQKIEQNSSTGTKWKIVDKIFSLHEH